ncbi:MULTISPECIES: hypothetical protein [Paraburkholderia]|uniref:hypothetical protein n=1 Tax=Paraburkholderia TaxID=1822464 RepID=UPI0013574BA2|nr:MULTISPECIES: hypothetical protein [Paraburkholderia]
MEAAQLRGSRVAPVMYGLATGESIAYLNYLVNRGMARAHEDDDGVAWYRVV